VSAALFSELPRTDFNKDWHLDKKDVEALRRFMAARQLWRWADGHSDLLI